MTLLLGHPITTCRLKPIAVVETRINEVANGVHL